MILNLGVKFLFAPPQVLISCGSWEEIEPKSLDALVSQNPKPIQLQPSISLESSQEFGAHAQMSTTPNQESNQPKTQSIGSVTRLAECPPSAAERPINLPNLVNFPIGRPIPLLSGNSGVSDNWSECPLNYKEQSPSNPRVPSSYLSVRQPVGPSDVGSKLQK